MFGVSYFVGLAVCWLVGVVLVLFAGRAKENPVGTKVPKFILGTTLFTVIGVVPYANLALIAVAPLLVVYSLVYFIGRMSSTFSVSFKKD